MLSTAAQCQQPLTLELAKLLIEELAKLLIDVGAFNKDALRAAAEHQQPLTLELAKLLIDVGAFDGRALSHAAYFQQPLTLELTRLLIDAGCDPTEQDDDGWDALVHLAAGDSPVDPQVTDLFLSAGCRMDLDGCRGVFYGTRLRFDQILKEHTEWKEKRDRVAVENMRADPIYGPDWGR